MTAQLDPDPGGSSVEDKGLKAGALGLTAAIVIGVASTAPGYSLAASVGYVTGEVGLQAPAIMLVAFIPMAFIAAAYFYMNRADPDCGTTFTWATRALGPRTGWLGGWGIIMADLVIMPNLAGITAQYTFLLFGLDDLADNYWAIAILGCLFILAMTWICVTGIELSARSQVLLLGTEIVVLVRVLGHGRDQGVQRQPARGVGQAVAELAEPVRHLATGARSPRVCWWRCSSTGAGTRP